MSEHTQCHETVDPNTRTEMLEKYGHRCQGCGRRGPAAGGLATLHVHHLERNPEGMDEHAHENLTVQCRACHSWQHQQTTEDDVPVEISEEDLTVLLPQDIEILRLLADSGTAKTGEIAAALTSDLSVTAVRERLWVLMGLDNIVESRNRQVVDKDLDSGEWGLTGQIANSERGRIPDDPQLLLQRAEDEQVRQALQRGCDRKTVGAVLGISRRTTFYKEKRANAYDFPLDALDGRGGRPPGRDTGDDQTTPASASSNIRGEGQQQLDDVAGDVSCAPDESANTTDTGVEDESLDVSDDVRDEQSEDVNTDVESVRGHLQQAIKALQVVDTAL